MIELDKLKKTIIKYVYFHENYEYLSIDDDEKFTSQKYFYALIEIAAESYP